MSESPRWEWIHWEHEGPELRLGNTSEPRTQSYWCPMQDRPFLKAYRWAHYERFGGFATISPRTPTP